MRIIAGKCKGLNIVFSKDKKQVRPTQDRVREALFSIIQSKVVDANFLDLFCGSGGVGLEALSRDANEVVFVDSRPEFLQKNLVLIKDDKLKDKVSVIKGNVLKYIKYSENKFDIIFLDPPWDKPQLYVDSLKAISEFDILMADGLVICEHEKKYEIKSQFGLKIDATYNYGGTVISILTKEK